MTTFWCPLKYALHVATLGTVPIKGAVAKEPADGLFPGYSASGQDVWLQPAQAPFTGSGLVLSAVGARCGKVFQATGRWGVVANTTVLMPRPGNDPRFLWYLINNENFWERGVTAQPYVRTAETMRRRVYIPPTEVQQRIVRFLDEQVGVIDNILKSREGQLKLVEDLGTASRSSIFDRHRSSAQRLRHVVREVRDQVAPINLDPNAELIHYDIPTLSSTGLPSSMFPADFASAKTRLKSGDLLVSKLNPRKARVYVVPQYDQDVVGSPELVCLRLSRAGVTSSDWLRMMLLTEQVRQGLDARVQSVTRSHQRVSPEDIRDLRVPLPSLQIQHNLLRVNEAQEDAVSAATGALRRSVQLLGQRRRELIATAVTGQLDVTTARSVTV